ncbi:MAG: thioredoxin family protein [Bacteroidales bacterium]
MRKIILVSILSIFSFGVFAQQNNGVKWEEGTFAQALAKANKQNKQIFLDCYTSWCGPCKHMANNVFTLPEAGKFFNSTFVNVKIDMEKGEGIDLCKKLGVKAFPTFLVLDSQGNEVGRIVGGAELQEFIGKVKIAMSVENSPAALLAKYESTGSIDLAFAYMSLLEESYKQEEIVKFIEAHYDNFGRALHSEQMWKYIAMAMVSDSVYDKVMAGKYEFDEALTPDTVNKAVATVQYNKLVNYLTGKLTLTPQEVKLIARDLAFAKQGRNLMLTRTVSDIALAYSVNDTAAIQKSLNLNFLNQRLTGHERYMLNAMVLQKGIFLTDGQKAEYKLKIK